MAHAMSEPGSRRGTYLPEDAVSTKKHLAIGVASKDTSRMFASLASIAFFPFDRLWLRSLPYILSPPGTPHGATELTVTAAARLMT